MNSTFIKRLLISTLIVLTSVPTQAVSVYFSADRVNRFACTISRSIKEAYPEKSKRDFKKEIQKILRNEINPWVNALPIAAGISLPRYIERITGMPGFPMSRSEYYLQNAFMLYGNPKLELKEPVDNYFASFIHLARKRHVSYLNMESPKFKLRNEEDLLGQIEDHLPNVANNSYPYLDENGVAIKHNRAGIKEKHRFTLAIGKPEHKKYDQFVTETQKYNHFSTPLFLWLLEQEDFSISPERLFEKALEIYEDPMVALGVIPWVMSGDALTVNRGTSSVASYKIERLVEGNDIPGYQYHFWGYLTQSIIGNGNRVGALAYIYEKLYQKDIPDWKVDLLSIKLGKQVRYFHKKPERCL
ncbi:hypothetical protein A9Q84_13905 [Halobacteriovorax marinus]|uniref:Lipoprotein n=1 Tax=Halobacteriovorax marinus TaxID=97084 RepID=A0A1Y5F9G4_9BACT|nr:hypothetical protein A9Q84_13905 [Halobacteriovorax marinus]